MMINGCFYGDERVCQFLDDLELAVTRMPAGDPLRAQFEFLFGYIDTLDAEEQAQYDLNHRLNDALEDLSECKSAVNKALATLGLPEQDGLDDAVISLIEYAQKKPASIRALESVRV
jgi:hypothetical protein